MSGEDIAPALENEFDLVAGWTRDAILRLGPDHALPASCRGTSSPAMLDWLARSCRLAPGQVLLDVGGGLGGPAAYAAQEFGVRPVNAEPMPRAARAAAELLGIGSVVATGSRLPLGTHSVDAVWCLGVLCTTTEKARSLAELHRVLRPGGSLGLMVLTADQPRPPDAPEGNVFPSREELGDLLAGAGFDLVEELDATQLADPPPGWTDRLERVQDLVRTEHGDDPRMAVATDQEARMGALFAKEIVRSWLGHAVAG